MKALIWKGPKIMEYIETEKPSIADDEILVRVKSVGICGSDLEGYLGHNSLRKPPLFMGHEFSGTIENKGDKVNNHRIGENIVVNPFISCGSCDRCIRGYLNLCDHKQIIGIHRPGSYAEYAAVPAQNALKIPNDMSFETASLTEPLACALRATRRALEEVPFANVVVIGGGTLGILSAFVSQRLGASRVVVLDINSKRIETVKQLGFDGVLDSSDPAMADTLNKIMGSKGIDIVIDAAGFQPTRELAMNLLNPGGVLMNIGLGVDQTHLPINHLIRSEIQIKGSFCYTKQDFADALEMLAQGKISQQGWSTQRSLEEGPRSFEELVQGEVPYGKIFLKP